MTRAPDEAPSIDEFRDQLTAALPKLRGFARAYCRAPSDADDAVQSTCERALARWRQWSGRGALDHWLIKILVNVWRDELRARKLRSGPELGSVPEPSDGRTDIADQLLLEQVGAEVLKLPDRQRQVLLLVVGEAFSYQEAATALDVPIGTVMSRLSRARRTLIDRLGIGDD